MALSGMGHISWQMMQGVSRAHGRQRSRSMHGETDHLRRRFSPRPSLGIAPEGHTCPQAVHE